jgi:hypothetical protein
MTPPLLPLLPFWHRRCCSCCHFNISIAAAAAALIYTAPPLLQLLFM